MTSTDAKPATTANPFEITRESLLALIEKVDLPAGIKQKIKDNPHLLLQVVEALGAIRFREVEGNRAYAFLPIVDRSDSVYSFAPMLVKCIVGTFEKLKTIQTSAAIIGGCVAITDEVQGGEVMVPFAPAKSINLDTATFTFTPGGLTPLYDTVVVALVALRILARLALDAKRIKLVPLAYIVTDGAEFGSKIFTQAETATMVEYMRTGRHKGRVAGVAVCHPGENLAESFAEIGIPAEATREIGRDDEEALEELFNEISRSVATTSQSGETAGF